MFGPRFRAALKLKVALSSVCLQSTYSTYTWAYFSPSQNLCIAMYIYYTLCTYAYTSTSTYRHRYRYMYCVLCICISYNMHTHTLGVRHVRGVLEQSVLFLRRVASRSGGLGIPECLGFIMGLGFRVIGV